MTEAPQHLLLPFLNLRHYLLLNRSEHGRHQSRMSSCVQQKGTADESAGTGTCKPKKGNLPRN